MWEKNPYLKMEKKEENREENSKFSEFKKEEYANLPQIIRAVQSVKIRAILSVMTGRHIGLPLPSENTMSGWCAGQYIDSCFGPGGHGRPYVVARQYRQTENRPIRNIPEPIPLSVRKSFRKSWARLIAKVYEVDPLLCPKCGSKGGGGMKIVKFVTTEDEVYSTLDALGIPHEARGQPP